MANTPANFLEQLKQVVLQRAADDDLVLPSLPEVVAHALALLGRSRLDVAALAAVIELDPLVSARLLRVANSPAYATLPAAVTVAGAVENVGQTALRSFLQKVASEPVFTSRDEAINRACRRFWEHNLATALLARKLALTMGAEAKVGDAAYLAGLLHDLGKPIVAALMLDAERRLMAANATRVWLPSDAFVEFVTSAHRTIGLLVAARWELPALVRHALADVGHYDHSDAASVPNIVRLANVLAKRAGVHIGGSDRAEVDALIAEGAALLRVDGPRLSSLCEGVAAEVAAKLA